MFSLSPGSWDLYDWMLNAATLLITAGVFFALTRPRFTQSDAWRATVTPLASIIGSGFLVVAPLLGATVGPWSIVAVTVIVTIAWFVGGAVRHTIAHIEELEADDPLLRALGHLSRILLMIAYVIAVAFYLELLGAFLLSLFGHAGIGQKLIATALLVFIGGYGLLRGLHSLETLEEYTVDAKLAVILALLVALVVHNIALAAGGDWHLPPLEHPIDMTALRQIMGAFLIVQGFETSRYLRGVYPPDLRVRTMKAAQLISAGIYIGFVGLITVMIAHFETISETAILPVSGEVAALLPLLLVLGATMSQFSSAVADTIASGGLAEEESGGRIRREWVYAVTAGLAIGLIWTSNIFEIIAYASRAFAAYYAAQCLSAAIHARREGQHPRAILFAALALLMAAITVFALSAESGGG